MTAPDPDELVPTRLSLLARLKDWDDQKSWQDFFNTYWKLIYGVSRKAGLTDPEAQDAVQDTVVAVVKHIKEFKYDPGNCSFKTWLMMIARQRIIWQLRKRLPQSLNSSPAADDSTRTATIDRVPDPDSLNLDAIWTAEWEQNLMSAALEQVKRQVSAKQFQIFDLYVLQRWTVKEVATMLRVTATQVYLAKHRVSALLKKEVRKLECGQ